MIFAPLKSFSKFNVVYSDPYIEKKLDNVKGNFKIFSKLITAKDKYDVIIITLPHQDFITSKAKIKKVMKRACERNKFFYFYKIPFRRQLP